MAKASFICWERGESERHIDKELATILQIFLVGHVFAAVSFTSSVRKDYLIFCLELHSFQIFPRNFKCVRSILPQALTLSLLI